MATNANFRNRINMNPFSSNSLTHSLMSNAQLREEVRLWRKRGSRSRGSRRAPARRPITRRMEASMMTREYVKFEVQRVENMWPPLSPVQINPCPRACVVETL